MRALRDDRGLRWGGGCRGFGKEGSTCCAPFGPAGSGSFEKEIVSLEWSFWFLVIFVNLHIINK